MFNIRGLFERYPWIPYVAPFATFLALTALEGQVLGNRTSSNEVAYSHNYLWIYAIKMIAVSVVAFLCRDAARDLLPLPKPVQFGAAVILGLVVAALWVGLDPYYPRFDILGKRTAFDPAPLKGSARIGFYLVRLYGLVLVVPLIEELFWRSFLMRWVIDQDFKKVPIGRVTITAAAVTSVLFALEHPEWLPGLLTGLLWAGLLAWSRSVSACWISHLVANAALGAYVIATHRWEFW